MDRRGGQPDRFTKLRVGSSAIVSNELKQPQINVVHTANSLNSTTITFIEPSKYRSNK